MKLCVACRQERTLDQFRRRYKGGEARHNECRYCYNALMRDYRAERRQKKVGTFVRGLARWQPNDAGVVLALCRETARLFGGAKGLAKACHDFVRAAPPGSHLALAGFKATFNLFIANDYLRQRQAERQEVYGTSLTDEQLDEQLRRSAYDVLSRNPRLVMRCAAELGWQVIPPEGTNDPCKPVVDRAPAEQVCLG